MWSQLTKTQVDRVANRVTYLPRIFCSCYNSGSDSSNISSPFLPLHNPWHSCQMAQVHHRCQWWWQTLNFICRRRGWDFCASSCWLPSALHRVRDQAMDYHWNWILCVYFSSVSHTHAIWCSRLKKQGLFLCQIAFYFVYVMHVACPHNIGFYSFLFIQFVNCFAFTFDSPVSVRGHYRLHSPWHH